MRACGGREGSRGWVAPVLCFFFAEPLLLEGPLVGLVVRRVHALRDQIQSNMFVRAGHRQHVHRDRPLLADAVDPTNRLAERGEVEQGLEEDGPARLR